MNPADSSTVNFVPWLAFAGIVWSATIIDISAIKTYVGTGWFRAFLPAALLAAIAPLLYLAISVGSGGGFPLTVEGIQVKAYPFARPYSPSFFWLCAAIGVVASLIKGAVLFRFSRNGKRPLPLIKLVLLSVLSATAAIGEMNLNSKHLMAAVAHLTGVDTRQLTGQSGQSLDPQKIAQPILDYYRNLEAQRTRGLQEPSP